MRAKMGRGKRPSQSGPSAFLPLSPAFLNLFPSHSLLTIRFKLSFSGTLRFFHFFGCWFQLIDHSVRETGSPYLGLACLKEDKINLGLDLNQRLNLLTVDLLIRE